MRRTAIGITIGPSCDTEEKLLPMIEAGVDFVRLNFSHGNPDTHAQAIKLIHSISKKTDRQVKILQDLQGPKIRLGKLPDEGVKVNEGQTIIFNTTLTECRGNDIPVTLPGLEKSLRGGEKVLVDDGLIELKIKKIEESQISFEVINSGTLKSHKGMNFPDSTLIAIPALSEKDKEDVLFGVEHEVDIVALSFVKRPEDVEELKELIVSIQKKLGKQKEIEIIAKVERPEAVQNIQKILKVVDGIMVARGDLGMEMPESQLPITQKNLIAAAKEAHKPVMVATQLLYSMEHNRRPTRAEVNDIANAVIDGATSLLLTNETAVGEYPLEAVQVLNETIVTTESSKYDDKNDV